MTNYPDGRCEPRSEKCGSGTCIWPRCNTPEPTDNTAQTDALMSMGEAIRPFAEAAQGMRAQMVTDGWSDGEAEATAGVYLRGLITLMLAAQIAQTAKPPTFLERLGL